MAVPLYAVEAGESEAIRKSLIAQPTPIATPQPQYRGLRREGFDVKTAAEASTLGSPISSRAAIQKQIECPHTMPMRRVSYSTTGGITPAQTAERAVSPPLDSAPTALALRSPASTPSISAANITTSAANMTTTALATTVLPVAPATTTAVPITATGIIPFSTIPAGSTPLGSTPNVITPVGSTPILSASGTPQATTPPSGAAKFKPRVLLAEDQIINQKLVSFMLRDTCEVVTVSNGLEAISVVNQSFVPDLILMDINMYVNRCEA